MNSYLVVKWVHILSSTLLFGTGLGSAYYMLFTSLTGDARVTAVVVKWVVRADWLFTTPTVILQPLSGFWLLWLMGIPLTSAWILWSIALYLVAGAAWLPVVWMQIRMRNMATEAARAAQPLPVVYWRYLRIWIALGVVAFSALVVVFYLMVAKPV
jgi:uncharacterized membrane protein